jgi:hypothetical protein
MLVLNRSLLNREYILINVLKALASIISMCNLHVTFLSKITPRYFTLFTYGSYISASHCTVYVTSIYIVYRLEMQLSFCLSLFFTLSLSRYMFRQ